MDFKDLIKKRRISLGLTLEQVGDIVGVSKTTIQRWESGVIENQRRDKLELLAKALRVTPAELMGWEANISARPINFLPLPATKRVPRIGTIACGEPILAVENVVGYDEVPEYIHADFTLVCKGDSMINARIYDGDIVYIKQQTMVDDGQIAAVLVGEEATLKRVRIYPDHIVLEPANPTYEPLVYWRERMEEIRIIGRATHFISVVR